MVDAYTAVAVGLVVPPSTLMVIAVAYRLTRGAGLGLSRRAFGLLALLQIAIGIVALLSVLAGQPPSGPSIPVTLAVASAFLILAVRAVSRIAQ